MKLIKRHKGLAIICVLTLILLLIIFAIFSRMLFSRGKNEYGDRLNNIVKIDSKINKKLVSELKENEQVVDASVRIQGKIVYIKIVYAENTGKDAAKEIAKKTLEYYDEEVINCYDFEYFLTQEPKLDEDGNDLSYVVAGTKYPNNDYISWTKG